MMYSLLPFLATLLAGAANCAPTGANSQAGATMHNIEARTSINDDCGPSTFVNQGSAASPTVSDCQQIAKNIAGGGTWTVQSGTQHQLVQYGTCAFGVKCGRTLEGPFKLGNQDIIDIINGAISQFGNTGLVGAKGDMLCSAGFGAGAPVTWGIYHN